MCFIACLNSTTFLIHKYTFFFFFATIESFDYTFTHRNIQVYIVITIIRAKPLWFYVRGKHKMFTPSYYKSVYGVWIFYMDFLPSSKYFCLWNMLPYVTALTIINEIVQTQRTFKLCFIKKIMSITKKNNTILNKLNNFIIIIFIMMY